MAATNMLGLTTIGTYHTAIGIIALIAGAIALARDKRITPENALGKVYIATTLIVCLSGFFIFQHGGFGVPHALGIVTLATLALATVAGYSRLLGRASPYIATVAYSATYFFHLIPTTAEGFTRLPPGAPLAASPEAPLVQAVTAGLFVLFLIGAYLQVRMLRGASLTPRGHEDEVTA
jgi:uncharacterized membrane protein